MQQQPKDRRILIASKDSQHQEGPRAASVLSVSFLEGVYL